MSESREIKVGSTYQNRGAGRTIRTVLAIGNDYRPDVYLSSNKPPDEPGVLYRQGKRRLTPRRLYLSSFKAWAGAEI